MKAVRLKSSGQEDESSKLMRWALALQEFDVVFMYKEGRCNTAADCLSRVGPHLPQPAE